MAPASRPKAKTKVKAKGKKRAGESRARVDSQGDDEGSHLPGMDESFQVAVSPYGLKPEEEAELEELEARFDRRHTLITNNHSWSQVCKSHHKRSSQLPFELHEIYRIWLLTKPIREGEMQLHVEDLPRRLCEGRGALKDGLKLPYPSGPHWQRLVSDVNFRKTHKDKVLLGAGL